MQIQTRRAMLVSFVLLFLVGGITIVFYAQGWRLNPEDLSLRKVGALYVKSNPVDTTIHLNEKTLQKRRSFLSGGVFIHNLFPGTHKLRVEAPDYHPLTATVSISPSLITRLSSIVLVPEDSIIVIPDDVSGFWKNNHQFIVRHASGTLVHNGDLLPAHIVAAQSPQYSILANKTDDAFYLTHEDEEEVVNLTQKMAQGGLTLRPSSANILSTGDKDFVATTPLGTYVIRNQNYSFTKLSKQTAQVADHAFPWAAWSSKNNPRELHMQNLFSSEQTPKTHVFETAIRQISLANGSLVVLEENGGLSLLSLNDGTFLPIASNAKQFTLSPKKNKLAVLETNSVEIFSLQNSSNAWRFDFAKASTVDHISWYKDGEHLFLHYPNNISFLSLDDAHLEYVTPVAETTYGVYNPTEDAIYYLSGGSLLKKQFAEK